MCVQGTGLGCVLLLGFQEYEPIYKAQLLCRAGQQALELGSVKRKWEEEHEEEMSSDSVS